MGRGGSTLLWSSSVTGCAAQGVHGGTRARRQSGKKPHRRGRRAGSTGCGCGHPSGGCHTLTHVCGTCAHYNRQGYRIKPHGQLVLVSCTHCCASTSSLSTSWSRTTLQGAPGPGIPNLQTSFPLRCLQRLSLPHIATRQCHWRDNRYTRGASTPVLSY